MSTAWQQKYPVPVSSRYGFFYWDIGDALGRLAEAVRRACGLGA